MSTNPIKRHSWWRSARKNSPNARANVDDRGRCAIDHLQTWCMQRCARLAWRGRVNKIVCRTVWGTDEQVNAALLASRCSRKVNTSFVERQNGTDRNRCSRKVRKSYCFSKNWDVHGAATRFSLYSYNFCWAVRTLCRPDGQKGKCTPAMVAGLADHVWTIREWIIYPVCQC